MKQTVIQCITALLCVVALAITGMTSVNKIADATVQAAKSAAEAAPAQQADAASDNTASDVPSSDAAADDSAAPADATAADAAADTSATDAAPADSSSSSTPAAAKDNTPASKAEIISYYNNAVNKVISSKAGYTKKRTTHLSKLEGAEAIMKIQVAADAVNSFLGVGDLSYTNKKGTALNLSQAALTDADVKSATCTNNNGIYTITMTLADGKSTAPNGSDTSPLKRSGLLVGNDDKSEYDYKNAQNIHIGLNNADNASVEAVSEETKNTKIVAVIDSKTGNMQNLTVSFDWTAALTNVKYTIIKISGTGIADTKVVVSGFQF